MKYRAVLSAKAVKSLDRLDRKTEERIQARLDELTLNPYEPRISKQMETAARQRYSRVGNWRIVYEIDAENHRFLLSPFNTVAGCTKK